MKEKIKKIYYKHPIVFLIVFLIISILFLYWYSNNNFSIFWLILLVPITWIAAIFIGATIIVFVSFIESLF